MAAEPAPEPSTEKPTPAAGEPRHLHPVPTEPAAQHAEDDNAAVEQVEDTDEDTDNDESFEDEPAAGIDLSGWISWAREVFSPQSGLWTTRPLAPDEVLDRARHGQQVADAGPLRAVSTVHGYASAGAKLAMRTVEWVFCEHLARCVGALVLLTALCVYPPTATVLGYGLTPLVWVHDLLI